MPSGNKMNIIVPLSLHIFSGPIGPKGATGDPELVVIKKSRMARKLPQKLPSRVKYHCKNLPQSKHKPYR